GDKVEKAEQEAHNITNTHGTTSKNHGTIRKIHEQAQLLKFQESIRVGLTFMTTLLIKGRVDLTQEIDQFGL
ncbi:hypothetical protein H5410_030955, partial [Solanum commersonii]